MDNQRNENYNNYPRKKNSGWAIILIIIGAVFLLYNIDVIPYSLKSFIISWPMLLLALGIWQLTQHKSTSGITLVVIGGFFLIPRLGVFLPMFDFYINMNIIWPLLLIIIGVTILLKNSQSKARTHKKWSKINAEEVNEDLGATDFIDKSVIFSSSTEFVLSNALIGGEVSTVMGETILDLRKAKLKNNKALLSISTIFGSCIIYAPSHWNVQINSQNILGSFSDKRYNFNDQPPLLEGEEIPILIITGSTIFASGEIRN